MKLADTSDFTDLSGRFCYRTMYLRNDIYLSCLCYCYCLVQALSAHLPFYLNEPSVHYALCDCEAAACVFSAAGILFSGCISLVVVLLFFLVFTLLFHVYGALCCDKPE